MKWIKPILTMACCHGLLLAVAQAESTVAPLFYQCPAFLQLDSQSYALEGTAVYDGPIEDRATLKPEPVPDDDNLESSFWDYGDYSDILLERTLHLKCSYKNTGHYLVLEAKGAHRCTFTRQTRTQCE